MSKQAKKVSPANVAPVVSFATTILMDVRSIEARATEVSSDRKAIMERLAAAYGAQVLRAAKDGGYSGNKMRTEDSRKAHASDLGISLSALMEFKEIHEGINAIRANTWQDYQRAYFGDRKVVKVESTGAENVKQLKARKVEVDAAISREKHEAKVLEARAMLADDDTTKESLVKEAKQLRESAKHKEIESKRLAEEIKETAELNAGATAYANLTLAIEALVSKYKDHKDSAVSSRAQRLAEVLAE